MSSIRIVLCLLVLCSCETATGDKKQVKFYPEGSEFRQVAQAPAVGSRQRRSFDQFKALGNVHMRFFGAFAASSNDGEVWWVGNFHSLEAANREALKKCRALSKRSCEIVGNIVPLGFVPTDAVTTSENVGRAWRRYQSKPGPKAMALGTKNNYASNFGGGSIERVRARALSTCSSGSTDCRIIAEEP